MRFGLRFLGVVVGLCLLGVGFAGAQSVSFEEALSGKSLPGKLKVSELTDDYKPFRLTLTSEGAGVFAQSGSWMSQVMFQNRESGDPKNDIFAFVGTYWSNSKTVRVGEKEFLVTYWLDMGFSTREKEPQLGLVLRLKLLRSDLISSIQPVADLSKERLEKAILDSKFSINDDATIEMPAESSIAMAIMLPVFQQAKRAAKVSDELSSVKQIGLALILCASDNEDVMPYVQSTGGAIKASEPYLKNNGLWWTKDGRRFLFNMAMSGVPDTSVSNPAETVLVYAERPGTDGRRCVAFADGHAKMLREDEWRRYVPTLNMKRERRGKPFPASYGAEFNTQTPPSKPAPTASVSG